MAEPNYSIALDTKPPDAMKSLGSIMDLAKGQQALQTGRIGQQRQSVALEQERGALDARRNVAKVMADPANVDPETGLHDLNKLATAASAADPNNYVWQEALKQTAAVNNDLLKVRSTALALGDQEQAYIGQRLGAAALEPNLTKADALGVIDDAVRVVPTFKNASIMRKYVEATPDDPNKLKAVLTKFRNLGFPLAAQAPQTALPQTGAATQPVQINPLGGPIAPNAPPIANQVGPAQAETQTRDALGRPAIEVKSPGGQISYRAPNSDYKPLMSLPPGETAQSAQKIIEARTEVNQAASQVPAQHFNNKQIVKLADTGFTGTSANMLAKIMSSAGMSYIPGDEAANYQQLGHFMALQTAANAKAMGAPAALNAAQAVAEREAGSAAWDAQAIKRTAKINDALATGVDYFNRGMERAIKDPNNPNDIFAARDFQNQWSKTFDVNAMRLHNAKQDDNKKEIEEIVREVGGRNSPGAKALAAKMRALDALIGP